MADYDIGVATGLTSPEVAAAILKSHNSSEGGGVTFHPSFDSANIVDGGALGGTCHVVKIRPTGDMTVNQMSCFITAVGVGTVHLGVYDIYGTLLCEASGSTESIAMQKFAVDAPVTLTGGDEYWFGILEGSGSPNFGKRAIFSNVHISMSKYISGSPAGMPADLAGFFASPDGYYIGAST